MARVREATAGESGIDVAQRLMPYLEAWGLRHRVGGEMPGVLDEFAERALTLVTVMPPHQRRETVEELVCPHDRDEARRAIDALIAGAYVAEDEQGCLRLLD